MDVIVTRAVFPPLVFTVIRCIPVQFQIDIHITLLHIPLFSFNNISLRKSNDSLRQSNPLPGMRFTVLDIITNGGGVFLARREWETLL